MKTMASTVLPKTTPQQAAEPPAGPLAGNGAPGATHPKRQQPQGGLQKNSKRYSKMIDEDDKSSSQIKMMSQDDDRSEE